MKRKQIYSDNPHHPSEVQEIVENATHCLNCGKKLSYSERKQGRRNRGFCSNACYLARPPKMIYVEKEYGKPIKQVILEMLNNGTNHNAIAGSLGIGKPQLYNWMEKLDIKKKVVYL